MTEVNKMDASNFASNSIDVDLVKASPSKVAVLLNAGVPQQFKDSTKLKFLVEIDGKQKDFFPNKVSVKNLIAAWGAETQRWIGQAVFLAVLPNNGRDSVIATPYIRPQPQFQQPAQQPVLQGQQATFTQQVSGTMPGQ